MYIIWLSLWSWSIRMCLYGRIEWNSYIYKVATHDDSRYVSVLINSHFKPIRAPHRLRAKPPRAPIGCHTITRFQSYIRNTMFFTVQFFRDTRSLNRMLRYTHKHHWNICIAGDNLVIITHSTRVVITISRNDQSSTGQ